MARYWFLSCFLFISFSCNSQENTSLIKNWHSYGVPVNRDSLIKYNWTIQGYHVYIKNDEVCVEEEKDTPTAKDLPIKVKVNKEDIISSVGDASFVKVNDGLIVGFNRGEWGGCVYWYSGDGKKRYKISNDEVIQFIEKDGKILAIQGLYHMGISTGSIVIIEKVKNRWASRTYTNLPDAPMTFTADDDGCFYVITASRIVKIDKANQTATLLKDGFWSEGLYPNSVVIKDGLLYIGMRGGVLKYNISKNEQTWLMNH